MLARIRRPRPTTLAVTLASVALWLLLPSSAMAGYVTGQVPRSTGYRVVLTSADGTVQQRRLPATGRFGFRASNASLRDATLHLLRPNGRYYGPVVLRRTRGAAWMLLSGRSVRLGVIDRGVGHARARAVSRLAVNLDVRSRANRYGVPVGANRMGLVRRRYVRSRTFERAGEVVAATRIDTDRDGVADVFDVDDDGDLRLDSADTSSGSGSGAGPALHMFTNMKVAVEDSLNVNAGSVSRDQVDALVRRALFLTFTYGGSNAEQAAVSSIDVNCFRLAYCRASDGVGVMASPPSGVAEGTRWATYDTNGDGLPNVWQREGRWDAGLRANVGIGQVGIGDSYVATIRRGSVRETVPLSLNFLFLTTPALKQVTAGGVTSTLSYPVASGDPGTMANPLALAGTTIDVELWRPQRGIVAGAERGYARDMGGLRWGVYVTHETGPGSAISPFTCSGSDFSQLSSTLERVTLAGGGSEDADPLRDTSPDTTARGATTLSYSLDLAACLARRGIATSGAVVTIDFEARNENSDNAAQRVTFRLP